MNAPESDTRAEELIACLHRLGVSADEVRVVDVERSVTLYEQGEHGDQLVLVLEGKVKMGCRAPDGRDHLLAIIGPRGIIGEESVFDAGAHTMSATAITNLRVALIDGDVVRACIARHPELANELMQAMARRTRRLNDHIFGLGVADVAGRVASQLLALGDQFGVTDERGVMHVQHDLSQGEIGQLIGAARETVNKVMSEFMRRGWIHVDGKSVAIVDRERLRVRTRLDPVATSRRRAHTSQPTAPTATPLLGLATSPHDVDTAAVHRQPIRRRPRRVTATTAAVESTPWQWRPVIGA